MAYTEGSAVRSLRRPAGRRRCTRLPADLLARTARRRCGLARAGRRPARSRGPRNLLMAVTRVARSCGSAPLGQPIATSGSPWASDLPGGATRTAGSRTGVSTRTRATSFSRSYEITSPRSPRGAPGPNRSTVSRPLPWLSRKMWPQVRIRASCSAESMTVPDPHACPRASSIRSRALAASSSAA